MQFMGNEPANSSTAFNMVQKPTPELLRKRALEAPSPNIKPLAYTDKQAKLTRDRHVIISNSAQTCPNYLNLADILLLKDTIILLTFID